MAGLDPAIHAIRVVNLQNVEKRRGVDARHKAGHDVGCLALYSPFETLAAQAPQSEGL
ncbi:MAG: hypothetical protein WAM55_11150 [Methylovirgula sp.]